MYSLSRELFVFGSLKAKVVLNFRDREGQAGVLDAFYTLWTKPAEGGEMNCLTAAQFSGAWSDPAASLCLAVPSRAAERTAFGIPDLNSPPFSPYILARVNSTAARTAKGAVCPIEARFSIVQLFVLACNGPSAVKNITCDTALPSQQLLVRIGCDLAGYATMEVLPQTDASVDLGTACVVGSKLERSAQVCNDPGAAWTGPTCVLDKDSGQCSRFSEAKAVIAELSPCEHADRLIFEPHACFDDGCNLPLGAAEIIDFEFDHYLGRRAIECMPDLDADAKYAGRAAVAVVSGTVAATVAVNVGGAMSASIGASAAGGAVAGTGTAAGSTTAAASTSSSGMGAMAMMGVVQFVAVTSNMCIVQGGSQFRSFFASMSGLDIFNLRIRLPKVMYV